VSLLSDIQKLEPGAIIELFVLDATLLGGAVNRFHAGTNELTSAVVWQANTYQPFPVEADGFDKNSKGVIPRPTLRVANVNGLIGSLIQQFNDLVGAKITRKRTLVKYLDAANFTGGVNPTADPNEEFPDDVFFVNRKSVENKIAVEFELAAAWDVSGITLPLRQVVQNVCPWVYRSPECSYAGGPVAKVDDTPTAIPEEDQCGKRIVSCKLRFGDFAVLPFGAFPGVGLIQ